MVDWRKRGQVENTWKHRQIFFSHGGLEDDGTGRMDNMSRSQICFSFTSVDLELESIKWIRSSHDSQHGNLKRLCAAYSSISSDR